MAEIDEMFLPKNSEINKREVLIKKVQNGELISNSKTPWTEKRLKSASEKKINQLYDNLNNKSTIIQQEDVAMNIFLSKQTGVKDFQKMMDDINRNPLLRSNMTKICGSLNAEGYTSMELFGAMMYSKFGMYLAPVSAFCTIFNHLDWEGFERISRERERFSPDDEINDNFESFDHSQVGDNFEDNILSE